MDPQKVALLFGEVSSWADPDDPGDRSALLAERGSSQDRRRHGSRWYTMLEIVATQIAGDDPHQVWRTAERLLADGMDREQVLGQLVLALGMSEPAPWEDPEHDLDDYLAALTRLPVPSDEEINKTVIATAASLQQPIIHGDLVRLAGEQLGAWPDDPLLPCLVDQMVDQIMFEGDGSIVRLVGELVVHFESFTAGIVLTHRLSEVEQDTDTLAASVDLAGFRFRQQLRLPGGDELERADAGSPAWVGPPGWLRGFPVGALLAVRVDEHGTVRLTAVDAELAVSDELVTLLDSVYDDEVTRTGRPVDAGYLVLGMLHQDPRTFSDTVAPLRELALAAGLECRGESFAHEESIWRAGRIDQRDRRVLDRLGPGPQASTALRMLHLLDDGSLDPELARELLAEVVGPEDH
ncbi:MAG: hypothetical protein ACRDTE_21955 [Pseudonocardiaceae bacterium]